MNYRKRLFFKFVILILCLLFSQRAFSKGEGTTSVEFLTLGVGGRATGLGEAYTTLAKDADALYWNPGALTQVVKRSAVFMTATYLESSSFNYGAYAQSFGSVGSLGVGFQYLTFGDLIQRDIYGAETESFNPSDMAGSVGYAKMLKGFSLGVSVKYIQSKILSSGKTQAVDIGVLSPPYSEGRLRFGVVIANMGEGIKYNEREENLPTLCKFGTSYMINPKFIVASDIIKPGKGDASLAMGTEFLVHVGERLQLAYRLGYKTGSSDVDGVTGIRFGLGVKFSSYNIDYGFLPMGKLGVSHRISLSYSF